MSIDIANFPAPAQDMAPATGELRAVLAGGCFWCTEAVYQGLDGVISVVSGYAGGRAADANYKRVCDGDTGHAECVAITFDPARVTFGRILQAFFSVAHDPTQKDRQGADRGTQYRSAIFYTSDEQRRVAESYIAQLDAAHIFDSPIVTQVTPLVEFFPAETYHQNYARNNPSQPYILFNATPKVSKMRKHFGS